MVGRRVDQELERERRAALVTGLERDGGGEVAPGAVAADRDPRRVDAQLGGVRELLRDRDDRVVRYDTGEPVTIDGRLLPDVNRQDAGEIIARDILRLPVLPPIEADPEAIRARRER